MDVREKLIKLIKNGVPCPDGRDPFGEYCDKCRYSESADCSNERLADYLIANGVTVQEWIPASEPPKKITNKVIVLCKNGYMGYGHYEDYKGERTWYNLESGKPFTDWDLEDCESYEVTHWMPLPQPPIASAPTIDAVPVVRCKDCKYFKTRLCENEDNYDDWFCADGERKDGDGNG